MVTVQIIRQTEAGGPWEAMGVFGMAQVPATGEYVTIATPDQEPYSYKVLLVVHVASRHRDHDAELYVRLASPSEAFAEAGARG